MKTQSIKGRAGISSLIVLLIFLLSSSACSYEPLEISGRVVDEDGNALSDVSVWACYSGWGWGKEEGYLVWDKDFCSETVQTRADGSYAITFEGPVSSRLRARKEGWVQSASFNATHSRIIMTKGEDYSARLRDQAKQNALKECRRKPMETDAGYYCRVVLSEARPVRLNYMDEVIVVTPTVLENENRTQAMFALQGSSRAVSAFAREIVLKVNGEPQDLSFSIKAGESACSHDLNYLEFRGAEQDAWGAAKLELFVPGIKAIFDASVHTCTAE